MAGFRHLGTRYASANRTYFSLGIVFSGYWARVAGVMR